MVIDDINIKVLEKASIEGKIEIGKAAKIVDGFYKGLIHVMEREKTIIKVPYFGKFIYSQSWKDKKDKIILEYKKLNFGA